LAFRSKQRGGTGLGLAIARDLAVAQGGNLKLTRSTADGSEFRLQLPEQIFDTPASAS
jgi:signal transduction histidine kinase